MRLVVMAPEWSERRHDRAEVGFDEAEIHAFILGSLFDRLCVARRADNGASGSCGDHLGVT